MDCPICGYDMRFDKQKEFYMCPRCATEVWPGELQVEQHDDTRELYRWSLAAQTSAINSKPVLPPGVPRFKGGSNKSGRKRKKKPKKYNKYINFL